MTQNTQDNQFAVEMLSLLLKKFIDETTMDKLYSMAEFIVLEKDVQHLILDSWF